MGDSSETVPAYARREAAEGRDPRACNVVFVDGNHSEDGVYADFVNFQHLSSRSDDWGRLLADSMTSLYTVAHATPHRPKKGGRGNVGTLVPAMLLGSPRYYVY